MIRSMVVLPQPEGPTKAPTSPWPSSKAKSRSTSRRSPAAVRKALRVMRTSSRPQAPTGRMSFKGLHQEGFDHQQDRDEDQGIGENTCHVEQLKRNADLKTHAVRPPEQLDHQHDLPHQR